MLKYWDNPEATNQVLDSARWMHTGDLAMMDEEGYIHISGRIKDLIIRGGENISPKEIEDFLYQYPNVLDAQVIGVPSEKFGEEVMAWIKVKHGQTLAEEELINFAKDKLHIIKSQILEICRRIPDDDFWKSKKSRNARNLY